MTTELLDLPNDVLSVILARLPLTSRNWHGEAGAALTMQTAKALVKAVVHAETKTACCTV